MEIKKTYYSISEVSKMLGIHEHTIRFWDSKLPGLSNQSTKGKTRFFNNKQINVIAKINDLLKNHDSLNLAAQIVYKNNKGKLENNLSNYVSNKLVLSQKLDKISKIKNITNSLKKLI